MLILDEKLRAERSPYERLQWLLANVRSARRITQYARKLSAPVPAEVLVTLSLVVHGDVFLLAAAEEDGESVIASWLHEMLSEEEGAWIVSVDLRGGQLRVWMANRWRANVWLKNLDEALAQQVGSRRAKEGAEAQRVDG